MLTFLIILMMALAASGLAVIMMNFYKSGVGKHSARRLSLARGYPYAWKNSNRKGP